jgi:IS6 family transposase
VSHFAPLSSLPRPPDKDHLAVTLSTALRALHLDPLLNNGNGRPGSRKGDLCRQPHRHGRCNHRKNPRVSYRDLEQMLTERGVPVDHTTIYRWVQRYAPELDKRTRWYRRVGQWAAQSWRVDETYLRIGGRWCYLYRALTSHGDTLDFYLSTRRNTTSAKRFLAKTLRSTAHCGPPRVINTDRDLALAAAITELKSDGRCATSVQHRRVKYLNNRIEGDHGRLKRIISPKRGFKTPTTAYRTLKGIEAMHALRKGQGRIFAYGHPNPDVVIVEKAFAYA